jgi:glutamate N-acetyltransferase/amino-acid N-acetyltransferase
MTLASAAGRVFPPSMSRIFQQPLFAPSGFLVSGVEAGIKKRGGLDMALFQAQRPCTAAALFTRNLVQAAPVLVSKRALERHGGLVSSVVINAGCANACTGARGMQDAEEMGGLSLPAGPGAKGALVMSTGVIGQALPMEKVRRGVALAKERLAETPEGWLNAAKAIMTTDTFHKAASRRVKLSSGQHATVTGITKGSGMIHPNMATMLSVIATDAALTPAELHASLSRAVDRSFHSITVDGDTSTNDTVAALASGAVALGRGDRELVDGALEEVAIDLAKLTAYDGEGAEKFVTVAVTGARSEAEARQVGRTIGTSPLVKTALYASDANWGRILAAAGYSGATFDATKVSLVISSPTATTKPLQLLRNGEPHDLDEARASEIFKQVEITLDLDLGAGTGSATVWTCDLGHKYVDINASYRS